MPTSHRLTPGKTISLANIPASGKEFYADKDKAQAEFKRLRQQFIDLQPRLYAEDRHKVLIVLQAMDAGGKDGTISSVLRGVNPQGVRVTSFKAPSKEELAHDYLWRIHKAAPARGMVGVFNRSHYEDVLVVRVNKLVPEEVWQPRYEQINQWEKMLVETGTTLLKFYLHISNEEQRRRFQERVDVPEKNWKFSLEDLGKRKQWGDYMAAYEEMLNRTTTPWAPWHVIPADQNWYRDLAVMRVIVVAVKALNPQFPPPETDLSGIVVE